MLVQNIVAFISDCRISPNCSAVDKKPLEDLEKHFAKKDVNQNLDTADVKIIVAAYKARWEIRSDTDYTLYPACGINQKWVNFAKYFTKELALETNKKLVDEFTSELNKNGSKELPTSIEKRYLYLLIPGVVNSKDYNDLALLTETENLENFFIGPDNCTLYRKRSLCEHLKTQSFKLSICRQLHNRNLSPITIEELASIRRCKPIKGAFEVGGEHFKSFDDFLKIKTFPLLHSNNTKKAENIVPFYVGLKILIDEYFSLKAKGQDIKLFKEAFRNFTSILYKAKLVDDVNYFYGIRIQDQGNEEFLIEYLISMCRMESYNKDKQFVALATWLYSLNREYKCAARELTLIYEGSNHSSSSSSPSSSGSSGSSGSSFIPALMLKSTDHTHPVWRILLSLFTTQFAYGSWKKEKVSFWDKKKDLPSVGVEVLKLLSPFIKENKPELIEASHEEIIQKIIKPALAKTDFKEPIDKTMEWLLNVESSTLSKLGVYWFEPELYLSALYKYKTNNPALHKSIKCFLDKLIHTCTQQKPNDIFKTLRVNILFAELMNDKDLDKNDVKSLIPLLSYQAVNHSADAKSSFHINFIKYVSRRLADKAKVTEQTAPAFINHINITETFNALKRKETVTCSGIIDCFAKKIKSNQCQWTAEEYSEMDSYLTALDITILSTQQDDSVLSSGSNSNYLFGSFN